MAFKRGQFFDQKKKKNWFKSDLDQLSVVDQNCHFFDLTFLANSNPTRQN